jgi:hypothetical protein
VKFTIEDRPDACKNEGSGCGVILIGMKENYRAFLIKF